MNELRVNSQGEDEKENVLNYRLKVGTIMAHPLPGEEVVITGISGTFPSSMNVHEYRDNLFNKVNMVLPNQRWTLEHPEIPPCSGTIPEIKKYDAGFFGIHQRQSQTMDPVSRMFQEKTMEAILDAGWHMSDLENTNTGVFIGSCNSEITSWVLSNPTCQSYAMTGTEISMIPQRLSYFLKLRGPSYTVDTACSSSMFALEHAYRAIRLGQIDAAIVGGNNLCLHPYYTLQFARLGVLSRDGSCKSFDAQGNGYARSEAITVIILQKMKVAKRVYAQVVHAGLNCDGFKEQGITFPSRDAQVDLLTTFYDECGVDRYSLSYLEAHGTGTFVGDPEECFAIDSVFTKHRKMPLLIGSVKSNIGHSEPASGICAVIKCIIGMETGLIPPNIHFTAPRKDIKGLVEGRMKVVVDKMPFQDNKGLIGVNSFGFGGANGHVLLRWNPKKKINNGLPEDDLPRLVCVSGRIPESIDSLLNAVSHNQLDAEFIGLMHEGFRKTIPNHLYRGYTIVSKSGELTRSLKFFSGDCPTLVFAFGELNNWYDIGGQLLGFKDFSDFIQRIQKTLLRKGVDIYDVLLNNNLQRHRMPVLGSVIVQLGIMQILNTLDVTPKFYLGHSFGELPSIYYNGILTLEETITCAFIINEEALKNNNNEESYNIQQVNNAVNSNGIPNGNSKSDKIGDASDSLRKHLDSSMRGNPVQHLLNTLKDLKQRDDCFAEMYDRINNNVNATNGSLSVNLDSVVLQIGSGPLVDNGFEDFLFISLFSEKNENCVVEFMESVGRLYELGYNPQISQLYPPIDFPVSRGTGMISPYVKWNHKKSLYVPEFSLDFSDQRGIISHRITVADHQWAYVTGHLVDGRNLFPAAGYLYIVWETFAQVKGIPMNEMNIVFDSCRFLRATTVPNKSELVLQVAIQLGSGNFEVVEGESTVVVGRISLMNEKVGRPELSEPMESRNQGVPLNATDIYKELRLRGYNYKGLFRGLYEVNSDATEGLIKWQDNWVTFLDNLFQMKILQVDTRLLYVPTFISRVTILSETHLTTVDSSRTILDNASVLPVHCNELCGEIRSGGVTVTGLIATSIARRKDLRIPVLEKYNFVPNVAELDIHQSVRVNMQIILENTLMSQVKAVEIIDEFTAKGATPLAPVIKLALQDQPLIQPFLKILSKHPVDTAVEVEVEVEDKKLSSETNCLLVVASNISTRKDVLDESFLALIENGFIISRESPEYNPSKLNDSDLTILTVHKTSMETMLLLQRKAKAKESNYIKISSSDDFSWISKVQEATKQNWDLVLYAEKEHINGILGLVNCLRREPDHKDVRCVFLMDEDKEFQPTNKFYVDQLKKNMAVNVYRNGQWGTYRHLLLDKQDSVEKEHCFVNMAIRGDLSSLQWVEGPLCQQTEMPLEKTLAYVYYAALNFKDVMTATGKIHADSTTQDRVEQENVLGFEFSGRDRSGQRVMGMLRSGALSSLVLADPYLLFKVPNCWSLEEAATVPVVYATTVYALIIRGKMRTGETILIHSGTGGIGQAAIRLSLYYGCTVYTTVGTEAKREFLRKTFPQLKDNQIGYSHDESFEQMIYRETNGRGVDMVLNSLAEDKLIASVRCLARAGRLLEIGKYDMASNNHLNLLLFQKEASYHGIMLDQVFGGNPEMKKTITNSFLKALKDGAIQPLNSNVFEYNEIEKAFRFMASGKHMGKVLIKIREPENNLVAVPLVQELRGTTRFVCDPEKTYIIIGGLGGFGLELVDWFVLRGARKIVLASRRGITTGYQNMRIRIWTSYGILIKISTAPVTTRDGCKQLLDESLELGRIDAIFNLAVVLEDSIFENQTSKTFETSYGPKATATTYLDELTRNMCPDLSKFVVFSSVSCGRGNAGQTNYGMSNSVMERICEKRKQDGYPALAIEWGAVGEVGLVANMLEDVELEISGTLQQKISSCLDVMDTLLGQKDAAVVSSMVVAEKRGVNAANNVVEAVANIIGLRDVKSISHHSTLAELGMDSMTGAEIKQVLERELEVSFTIKEIRTLTLARLIEIQEDKYEITQKTETNDKILGLEMLVRLISDASESNTPYLLLKSKAGGESDAPKVLLFPGIEGFAKVFNGLASAMEAHTIGLQYSYADAPTIAQMAEILMPTVEKYVSKTEPFNIVSYSYGTVIALEVVHILESRGYRGTLVSLDGSPLLVQRLSQQFNSASEQHLQTALMCQLLSYCVATETVSKNKEALFKCNSWEERVSLGVELAKSNLSYGEDHLKNVSNGIYWRLKAIMDYCPSYSRLESDIKLYKPKNELINDIEPDYGLSKIFVKPVDIKIFEGNHATFIEEGLLADAINVDIQKDKIILS